MKLHVSIKVEDFAGALRFYSRLFGQSPVIEKNGYAKWDVDDPAVNFVIETGNGKTGLVLPTREKNLHIKLEQRRLDRLHGSQEAGI